MAFTLKSSDGGLYKFADESGSEIQVGAPKVGKFYQFGDPTGRGGYDPNLFTVDPTTGKLVNIGTDWEAPYQGVRLTAGGTIPAGLKEAFQPLFASEADYQAIDPGLSKSFMAASAVGEKPIAGVIDPSGRRAGTAEQLLKAQDAAVPMAEAGQPQPQPQIIQHPNAPAGWGIDPKTGKLAKITKGPAEAVTAPKYEIPPVQPGAGEILLKPSEFELLRKAKGVSEANFDQYFRRDEQGNIYLKSQDRRLYDNQGLTANKEAVNAMFIFHLGRNANAEELSKFTGQNVGAIENQLMTQRQRIFEGGAIGAAGIQDIIAGGQINIADVEADIPDPAAVLDAPGEAELNDSIQQTLGALKLQTDNTITKLMLELQEKAGKAAEQAEAQMTERLDDYQQLIKDISETSAVDLAFEQYEISDKINKLEVVNQQIARKEAELQLGLLQEEDRLAPMSIISRRQARLKEIAAIDLGLLYASAQNIQGSIQLASQFASLKISEITKNQDRQIANYQFLLDLDQKNIAELKADEKAYLSESIELIQKEQEQIEAKKAQMLALAMDNPVEWAQSGASFADTPEQAFSKMQPFIAENTKNQQKLDDAYKEAQTAKINKEVNDTGAVVNSNIIDIWSKNIIDGLATISNAPEEYRTAINLKINKLMEEGYQILTPLQRKEASIIADDLRSEQAYRDMVAVRNGYQTVETGYKYDNGIGDLAIINGYQRMADPGAVVREGEFKTVEESTGFLQRILNIPSKLVEGSRLTTSARGILKKVADDLYNSKAIEYNSTVGERYKKRAEIYKIPYNIIGEDFIVRGGTRTTSEQKTYKTPEDYIFDFPDQEQNVLDLIGEGLSDDEIMDVLNFDQPLSMGENGSGYLSQYGEITGEGSPYWKFGLDIDLKIGDPVTAPVSGKVIASAWNGGFGNQVKIKGDDGREYWLSHLDSFDVSEGDTILAGQVIGKGGNTGKTIALGSGDGSHLDLTVKDKDGKYIPPSQIRKFLS